MYRTPCKLARENRRSPNERRWLPLNVSCRSLAPAVRTGPELLCCLCQRDKPVLHMARRCRYRESVIETSTEGHEVPEAFFWCCCSELRGATTFADFF